MVIETFDEIKIGDSLVFEKRITSDDVNAYLALSGDENPLHSDEKIAKTTIFGGLVAPGMIVASLLTSAVTKYLRSPILLNLQIKFLKPVRINDTVAAKIRVVEKIPIKRHVKFDCVCTVGDEVVCEGFLQGKKLN